jgi:hypothetical protein
MGELLFWCEEGWLRERMIPGEIMYNSMHVLT